MMKQSSSVSRARFPEDEVGLDVWDGRGRQAGIWEGAPLSPVGVGGRTPGWLVRRGGRQGSRSRHGELPGGSGCLAILEIVGVRMKVPRLPHRKGEDSSVFLLL